MTTSKKPIQGKAVYLTKLDAQGNPVGEPIPLEDSNIEMEPLGDAPVNHWSNWTTERSVNIEFGPVAMEQIRELYGELGPPPTEAEIWDRMTPRQRTEEDGYDRYSNSELATFKDCRRKWYLTYFRNLRLKVEPGTGVRWIGDRVHRALEQWYVPDGFERMDPRDAIERVLQHDLNELTNQAIAAGHEAVDPAVLTDFRKEADLQRIMVEGYMEWITENGLDSDFVVVEPEAYIEVNFPLLDHVKIIARIDVRVRRVSDDARLWLEHKTVGSFAQKLTGIQLDEQVLFQTLVEHLDWDQTGPRVVGVIYNMLRRVKRGPTAKPPFYRREEIHHNIHELESFKLRTAATIEDLWRVQGLLSEGKDHREVAYPRPSGDCSWKCPFFQICPMFDDGSRVEGAINGMYEVGDPYAYYQKTGEPID